MISRADIEQANARIDGRVRRTPIIEADGFGTPVPLILKLEYLQHTGSFKPRGAFNALLSAKPPAAGVVAVSGGNHGAAVAYVASSLGLKSRIFVPSYTSEVKLERMRGYGGSIEILPHVAEAFAAAEEYRTTAGALMIHPYDQNEVVIGQGTVGLELEAQAPDVDTVIISVGGGGSAAVWPPGMVARSASSPLNRKERRRWPPPSATASTRASCPGASPPAHSAARTRANWRSRH